MVVMDHAPLPLLPGPITSDTQALTPKPHAGNLTPTQTPQH